MSNTQYLWIASDHAGWPLKRALLERGDEDLIGSNGAYRYIDLGPSDDASVDYPDFADQLARQFQKHPHAHHRGILICGSGQGMAIRANRYPGLRAGLIYQASMAELARAHNDINVLCLGARFVAPEEAYNCILNFLKTPFEGGRHQQRVLKLDAPILGSIVST